MEAFFISTGVVALAEIGDKTQLLALLLAARFRKPIPIVLGILVATIANHFFAAAVGVWLMQLAGPEIMRWVLTLGFIAMGVWLMIPDKVDDDAIDNRFTRFGVFGSTLIIFFLAEMGDKTQLVTIALAAKYSSMAIVVAGSTLGMMLANAPVVWLGDKFAHKIPTKLVHVAAGILLFFMAYLVWIGQIGLSV